MEVSNLFYFHLADIDECAAPGAENLCKPGGTCQNVAGKFRCVCTAPFMKSDDEKHCLGKFERILVTLRKTRWCPMIGNRDN